MINEIEYGMYYKTLNEREAKAKELYSMLDQLYVFETGMSKDDIMLKIKRAYLRDKILTDDEYRLIRTYVTRGSVY